MGLNSLMQGRGLLGMQMAQPPAGLLGKYYDPKQERAQKLLMGLQGAGLALLQNGKGSFGEVIGQAAAGGVQGANNAGINYKNDAMGYQQLETQMNEQKEKERNKAAVMQWLDTLPPDQQELARVNPQMAAEAYMKNQLNPPTPSLELTDIGGKRGVLNKGTLDFKPVGDSPARQASVPTGYREKGDGIERIPGYRDTNLEMDMRKEFDAQSKDFRSVRDSYNRMQASAQNPSPAGDLSLIFNYMKMLDPNSVVRETEFATAAAAGSFGERIQGAVSQVTNGERLAPEIRADFLARSQQLYGEQEQTFQSLADQYGAAATRNGLDPQNIILTPRANPRVNQAAPQGVSLDIWNEMTPEQKSLWK